MEGVGRRLLNQQVDAGLGHKLLSFLFHCIHKNLSTFDPGSPVASDKVPPFKSSRKRSSSLSSWAPYKSKSHLRAIKIYLWCPGEDLNLHTFRHIHLKDTCIPISPPGHRSNSIEFTHSKDFWYICKLYVFSNV